jgi:16S rRNA G527 N7-methylase RsmG
VHLTPALARQWGPGFQGVMSRAAFPLARYLELGAPLVKPGGQLLALKGPGLGEAEWQEAVVQAEKNACGPPARYDYLLPLAQEKRWLVVWEKKEGIG